MTRLPVKVARLVESAEKLAAVQAEASRIFYQRVAIRLPATMKEVEELEDMCQLIARQNVESREKE